MKVVVVVVDGIGEDRIGSENVLLFVEWDRMEDVWCVPLEYRLS